MDELTPINEVIKSNQGILFQIAQVSGILLVLIPILLVALLLRLRLMFRAEMELISMEPCPTDSRKFLITALVTRRGLLTTRKVQEVYRGSKSSWRQENRLEATENESLWLSKVYYEQGNS